MACDSAAALSFAVSNLHDELHSDDVRMRVRRWTTADFEPQQQAGVALGATLDAYNEMKRQVGRAACFHHPTHNSSHAARLSTLYSLFLNALVSTIRKLLGVFPMFLRV
jgi:hypothetical protein